jgi:hypothetical protein
LLCLVLIFALSCSRYKVATTYRASNLKTYRGPSKPKDTIGYLACATGDLHIAEIDGVAVKEWKAKTNHDLNFTYVELLPGRHKILVKGSTFDTTHRRFHTNMTIDVSSYNVTFLGETKLSFLVKADHVYVIKSDIHKSDETPDKSGQILSIYIQDVRTEEIVCQVDTEIKKTEIGTRISLRRIAI